MEQKSCDGCENLKREKAGVKDGIERVFFICGLGRCQSARPVFEYAWASAQKPTVPVPAWCKLKSKN